MTYNEARKRATDNYYSKKKRVYLVMEPEEKAEIERKARKSGLSLNAYIVKAALEKPEV